MKGAKVKKVKVNLGKDDGISDMFNQMLGAGSINLSICYPKYIRMKKLCEQILKLIRILADSPYLKSKPEFENNIQQLISFADSNRIEKIFTQDLSKYEWNFSSAEDSVRNAFAKEYESVKKSNLIKNIILLCDRLVPHKQNFNDVDKLNSKFILNMTCAEWIPFPMCGLNFKYLFTLSDIGENNIRFFMTVLHKAHELSFKLWRESVSPDVDVDQFVEVIMNNIEEIQKKAPELSRCKKAFKKIKESVGLLKDQFNGYYRDFVQTKDSTIIMQNFIMDVSKSSGADPEVLREFRVIIKYYRKIASQQQTHPKLKVLFDKVNQSFKDLESGTSNLVKIKEDLEEARPDPDDMSMPSALSEEQLKQSLGSNNSNDNNNNNNNNTKDAK